MTLNQEEREELIRYNIEKSHQAIDDVKFFKEEVKNYFMDMKEVITSIEKLLN